MQTETITEEIVRKVEKYDADVMDIIRHDKDFPIRYLRNLRDYHENKLKYSYKEVKYEYPDAQKKSRLGRLYVKKMGGLQGFPTEIRNPLLDRWNWDVDMENAHFHLVVKLARDWGNLPTTAIQYYINNRAECLESLGCSKRDAKTLYLKAMYGGQIDLYREDYEDTKAEPTGNVTNIQAVKAELETIANQCWCRFPQYQQYAKKRNNRKFSLLALMIQEEEKQCLFEIDKYMQSVGRYVSLLIHDGMGVEKLDGELAFPEEHLRKAEAQVLEKTGHSLRLIAKRFQHSYKTKKDDNLVDSGITIDDAWGAERFADIMGGNLVKDGKVIWIFNTSTGIWSNDPDDITEAVTRCGDKLTFKQDTGAGIKVYNFSGIVAKTASLQKKLKDVLPESNGYFRKRINSDYEKLLFSDGIYNFKTGVFTEKFDREVVFKYVMPYPFPKRDEERIAEIRNLVFGVGPDNEPFVTQADSDTLRHSLMRASIGDNQRKKATLGQGYTNSGKGLLQTITTTAFGDWVATFEGNSLLSKSFVGEAERDNTFMMSFVDRRFAFSSEIRLNQKVKIDSNKFKQITSGGTDSIKMRRLNENSGSFINKATLFMFAQAFPEFEPPDGAMKERVRSVMWGKSYVNEPDPHKPYQRKRNEKLVDYYGLEENGIAFFWIMVDTYEEWRETGFKEPSASDTEKEASANLVPQFDFLGVLNDEYVITGKAGLGGDYVKYDELKEYMESRGFTEGRNGLLREFKALGLPSAEKKIDRKTTQVRLGIRRRLDDE